MLSIRHASVLVLLVGCLAAAAGCASSEDTAPAGGGARTAQQPAGSPERQAALQLLDSWQRPVLQTLATVKQRKAADLRRDRGAVDRITEDVDRAVHPVLEFSRDGRLLAGDLADVRLARAITRAGDGWAFWADAVTRLRPVRHLTDQQRRQASKLGDLGLKAIQAYGAAYRAAGTEPPPAFRIFPASP